MFWGSPEAGDPGSDRAWRLAWLSGWGELGLSARAHLNIKKSSTESAAELGRAVSEAAAGSAPSGMQSSDNFPPAHYTPVPTDVTGRHMLGSLRGQIGAKVRDAHQNAPGCLLRTRDRCQVCHFQAACLWPEHSEALSLISPPIKYLGTIPPRVFLRVNRNVA